MVLQTLLKHATAILFNIFVLSANNLICFCLLKTTVATCQIFQNGLTCAPSQCQVFGKRLKQSLILYILIMKNIYSFQ